MKQGKAILVTLVLASLLWPLGALPVQAMTTVAQAGVKPDAQIAIVELTTLVDGAKRSLKVGWKVLPQGGAVPLRFDVVARLKFTNGALDIVSKSVGGDIRSVVFDGAGTLSAKLNQSVAQKGVPQNNVSGNLKEADKAKAKAKTTTQVKAQAAKPSASKANRSSTAAPSKKTVQKMPQKLSQKTVQKAPTPTKPAAAPAPIVPGNISWIIGDACPSTPMPAATRPEMTTDFLGNEV